MCALLSDEVANDVEKVDTLTVPPVETLSCALVAAGKANTESIIISIAAIAVAVMRINADFIYQ